MQSQMTARAGARAAATNTRPAATAMIRQHRLCLAYSPTTRQQAVEETPALHLLDTALLAVLSLLGGPAESNSRQQQAHRVEGLTSEELQLPPELAAYLAEIEAAEGAAHGGWVHSHIAERLATCGDEAADA